MQDWIIPFMEHYGYLGVFLLILLENLFPPIPSEVILTFGGYMTTHTSMQVVWVVAAATAGSVLGAICLYHIGSLLTPARLEKLVERFGGYIGLKYADVQKAARWYERYGYASVFLCRMLPVVRSLISIPAGMTKMQLAPFLLFTTIGSAIWNTILINLGAGLGPAWNKALQYTDTYSLIASLFLALVGIYVLYRFWQNKKTS